MPSPSSSSSRLMQYRSAAICSYLIQSMLTSRARRHLFSRRAKEIFSHRRVCWYSSGMTVTIAFSITYLFGVCNGTHVLPDNS